MAAPANAFRTKSLKATKGSTTIDCLVAIPPSEPTDPEAKKALLKDRFYLDEILAVDEYDSAGTKIAGFIGACYEGSANHAMHAEARRFTLDGTKGTAMDFLNDAGLNTLGIILQPNPPAFDGEQAIFTVSVKAAHFVNTDGVLLNYSRNGETPTGDIIATNGYSVPAGQTQTKQLGVAGVSPTDTISIYVGNVNAEGTYKIGPFSYTVPFLAWFAKGDAQWPSQTLTMTPEQLYPMAFPIVVGTVIKPTTDGSFVRIDGGYYSDDNFWYLISDNNQTDSVVMEKGVLGAWPVGDPAYVPETPEWGTIEYIHYALDAMNGCIEMDTRGYVRKPRTIYINRNNNTFYQQKDTSGPLAAPGVYYDGTKTGDKWNWAEFSWDGKSLGTGICT